MDQGPRVWQNARVTNWSGSRNLDHCNCTDVLRKEDEPSQGQEQVKKHVVMVGSWPFMVLSEVHINGRCVSKPVRDDKGNVTVSESKD
jgi:hypothetical protein